jgi:hypothetical protein
MNRFKINLSLILALLVAGFYACQHEPIEIADSNQDVFIKNAAVYGTQSTPESDGGIAPYIIPGKNPGGNRTCAEVSAAFGFSFDFSSGNISGDARLNGTAGPITWTSDGTYIAWESTVPVKVAFIVKGGNDANVYFYGDCTEGDSGLASPPNASGNPAGLSNITICWTLCETDECFKGETAFGGNYAGGGPAWWFYYDTQGPAVQKIYAGQKEVAGASVKVEGGKMYINLGGMALQTGNETVKVQGYDKLPNRRPAAGLFKTYKGTDLEFSVAGFRYYVIHLDVMVPYNCR